MGGIDRSVYRGLYPARVPASQRAELISRKAREPKGVGVLEPWAIFHCSTVRHRALRGLMDSERPDKLYVRDTKDYTIEYTIGRLA